MSYWVFTLQSDCDAAQSAAAAQVVGRDALADGAAAPVQVTARWAIPLQLTDGRWAFPAKPGMALPSGAAEMDDISSLTPDPD